MYDDMLRSVDMNPVLTLTIQSKAKAWTFDPGSIVVTFNGQVLQGATAGNTVFINAPGNAGTYVGTVANVRAPITQGGKVTVTLMNHGQGNYVLSGDDDDTSEDDTTW